MSTTIRNGDYERVSFADTEIDAEVNPGASGFGMHTESGFRRVVDGNAFSGPHRRPINRTRTWRYALLVLAAAAVAIYRACTTA